MRKVFLAKAAGLRYGVVDLDPLFFDFLEEIRATP